VKVLPYTIADFLDDQAREFAFLKYFGYVESSSEWTRHEELAPGTLFGESVFTACPIVRYSGPNGRIVLAHAPRGEAQLSIESRYGVSEDLEEIARTKDRMAANRLGGIYDPTHETAGAVLKRLALGFHEYAVDRLRASVE